MKPRPWVLFVLFFIICLIQAGFTYYMVCYRCDLDWNLRSEFGQMYGAVGALFSGLAFAGVIYAVWVQHKQSQLLGFESTFFKMLQLQSHIRGDLRCVLYRQEGTRMVGSTHVGQDVLDIARRGIASAYSQRERQLTTTDLIMTWVTDIHREQCLGSNPFLGHYFRNLYHIIKYTDESNVQNKKRYTSLARAQLSSVEIELLLVNCLTELGRKKFKRLAEEYALFEQIEVSDLTLALGRFFKDTAYGDNAEILEKLKLKKVKP